DGASGADIGRATFEQPARNLLAMRDSLAEAVARFLRQRLGEEVRLREQRQGTQSVEAWSFVQQAEKARKEAEQWLRADSVEAAADLREAVALAPGLASAWSTLSHLNYQKPDFVEAKIDAQRAYEADAYLSVADQIVWRLYTTSYDLEQFADATYWCAEGRRRFPSNPRFVKCQLWLMTSDAAAPNPAQATRLVDELATLTPDEQWHYDS